jgi:hypothetical protein
MSAVRARGPCNRPKAYPIRFRLENSEGGLPVRNILAIGLAAVLLIPAFAARAGASPEAGGRSQWASDMSAAKKKGTVKRKAAPKEQYLRAVPSTPPAGAKR